MSCTPFQRRGASAARRALALLLLLAAAGGCTRHARPGDHDTVRAMTFNIFAGNDLERQSNLARVAALIDSLHIDVAFLQEVDRLTARSGGVDQPATLARLTRADVRFGASMTFDGGEFGNAIITRLPIIAERLTRFAQTEPPREPRSLLHVTVRHAGRPLHLIATHVEHRDSAARAAQLRQLEEYIQRTVPPAERIILGADLNARPAEEPVRRLTARLTDAWTRCGSGPDATFRSDAPDRRIDYILLRGLDCTHAWVQNTRISDHRPVIVHVTHE